MMTHDEMIAVIEADKAGKPIQRRMRSCRDEWETSKSPVPYLRFDAFDYRVKPEPPKPTLRPWRECEVPVGAVIRFKDGRPGAWLIVGVYNGGVAASCSSIYTTERMLEMHEWCWPQEACIGTACWSPCGVEE